MRRGQSEAEESDRMIDTQNGYRTQSLRTSTKSGGSCRRAGFGELATETSDFAKHEANHEINVGVDDSLVSNRFDRYKN